MLGVGYVVGIRLGIGLIIGALLGWCVGVPVFSAHYGLQLDDPSQTAMWLRHVKLNYVGLGAMFVAGLQALFGLMRPLLLSFTNRKPYAQQMATRNRRTERDLPKKVVRLGLIATFIGIFIYLQQVMPLTQLLGSNHYSWLFLVGCLVYIFVLGFLLVSLCGYFSGLVGVTATPGSAILIAAVLFMAMLTCLLLDFQTQPISDQTLLAAAAVIIFVATVIMNACAIAVDNIQDLKVGYILGATPWKQQLLLLMGVVIASLVIPPVIEVLFNVYGVAGVTAPGANIDPSQTLPAPPAAMMAAVTQAILNHNVPLDMLALGAGISLIFMFISFYLIEERLSFVCHWYCNRDLFTDGVLVSYFYRWSFTLFCKQMHRTTCFNANPSWIVSRLWFSGWCGNYGSVFGVSICYVW